MEPIFNYSEGNFCYKMSDHILMDSDGHYMQSVGDKMAIDMDSGEMHIIESLSLNQGLFDEEDD